MAKNVPPADSRLEKVLAGMMAGVLLTSIVSILLIVAMAATGQNQIIAIAVVFPMIGLPAAAVLLLALVIVRLRNARKS